MHFTGKQRLTAHSTCNLKYTIPRAIPTDMHNKSNFDFHLVIKHLADEFEGSNVKGLG